MNNPLLTTRNAGLILSFLPVNQAYAFTFGDSVVRMDIVGRAFFPTRQKAVEAAELAGLKVRRDGSVEVRGVAAVRG